jgi:hypothetical protein
MLTIIRYMHVLIIFQHLEEFLDSKHLQRAAISYDSLWWLFQYSQYIIPQIQLIYLS